MESTPRETGAAYMIKTLVEESDKIKRENSELENEVADLQRKLNRANQMLEATKRPDSDYPTETYYLHRHITRPIEFYFRKQRVSPAEHCLVKTYNIKLVDDTHRCLFLSLMKELLRRDKRNRLNDPESPDRSDIYWALLETVKMTDFNNPKNGLVIHYSQPELLKMIDEVIAENYIRC